MHDIEPYYLWRDYYDSSLDERSPFYKRSYSEFEFTNKIYNYYIHPQWDFFGSSTLYCKVLFVDYSHHFVVIELLGEWNDAVYNDIMELKKGLVDPLIEEGIKKFIIIGENVLNFHASDESYYEEWYVDVKEDGGWIVLLNFRDYVVDEMEKAHIHYYLNMLGSPDNLLWRKFKPFNLLELTEKQMVKSLE